MQVTVQVFNRNIPEKQFSFQSWEDLMTQINEWMSNVCTNFNLVSANDIWTEVTSTSIKDNDRIWLIPLKNVKVTSEPTKISIRNLSTLKHFLDQHSDRIVFFLKNPTYERELCTDIDYVLNSDVTKNEDLIQKLVTKIQKIQHTSDMTNILLQRIILQMMTISYALPESVQQQIKHLGRTVFESIIHSPLEV